MGDLVVFRAVPRGLSFAVVTHVFTPTRYRAIGILRGGVRAIEIDLSNPDKRRRDKEIINSVIRPIQEKDTPPYLYLAGELFSEFRRVF